MSGPRTAVVTGAGGARGIGRHVAERLAADGFDLALLDVDAAGAEAVAAQVGAASGRRVLGLGVDVTDPVAVEEAFARVDAELPPLRALVALAGIASPDRLLDITPERWARVMDVNATGTLFALQAAARRMIAAGTGGRIVTTSSITAYDGGGTFSRAAYAAAKAAVLGLTRGAARELGAHGITVNAITPGPVDTDIMGGELTDDRRAALSADVPVGRVGRPEEIAALVAFLVGEDAGYVNGASIVVDGGKHMI